MSFQSSRKQQAGKYLDADACIRIKELLEAEVPLSRVAELFAGKGGEHELTRVALEVATSSSPFKTDLACAILQRSKSAVRHEEFVDNYMASLMNDIPEELHDPLFFTLMKDPVVISTGYVVDRSSALDEHDRLKFHQCPFTRMPLKPDVYPLVDRKRRLHEFKEKRLDQMIDFASCLFDECNLTKFDSLVDVAERFLDDLGEETYLHRARKLAEIRFAAAELPGRNASPCELAKIFTRIHRTLPSDEESATFFQQKLEKLLVSARDALVANRLDTAAEWCDACDLVQQSCIKYGRDPKLPTAFIRLELAKKRGDDLAMPRVMVYRYLRADHEAVKKFLADEGLGMDDVREIRPIRLRCVRLQDSTADDDWHVAVSSPPLENEIAQVCVTADVFRDQGWGNQKGNLGLALYNAAGDLIVRCNLFGTVRSLTNPTRTLTNADEVVRRAQPGDIYRLEYTVGGGGGHSVIMLNLASTIYPRGWTVDEPTEVVVGDESYEGVLGFDLEDSYDSFDTEEEFQVEEDD